MKCSPENSSSPDQSSYGLVGLMYCPIETHGPKKRFGLLLQGCSIHCPDCISKHSWDFNQAFRMSLSAVLDNLRRNSPFTERLTISGGEPFDQSEFLLSVLKGARDLGYCDILLYTGYRRENLEPSHPEIFRMIDALVDGPFIASRPTDFLWCGSSNQRLHILSRNPAVTKLYQEYAEMRTTKSIVQLVQTSSGLFVVGLPKDEKWKQLGRQQTDLSTS